ncbi:MAG: F0F1 ATP synthase subunit epsilon, partial [Rhodothermales bacterium]|nr:F0F1 ATP synthase subunit epsilon [Rhodothermales bacterium]
AEERALSVLEEEGDRTARGRAERALDRARNRLRVSMARVGTSR